MYIHQALGHNSLGHVSGVPPEPGDFVSGSGSRHAMKKGMQRLQVSELSAPPLALEDALTGARQALSEVMPRDGALTDVTSSLTRWATSVPKASQSL